MSPRDGEEFGIHFIQIHSQIISLESIAFAQRSNGSLHLYLQGQTITEKNAIVISNQEAVEALWRFLCNRCCLRIVPDEVKEPAE